MAVQLTRDQQGRVTVRDPARAEIAQLLTKIQPNLRADVARIVQLQRDVAARQTATEVVKNANPPK